jgi:hypothetical protein
MYHTTGCTVEQIDVICGRIAALIIEGETIEFPPSLGLRGSVVIALAYLKTNRRQAELAEDHGTSQSTISRAIKGITASVARALAEFVPTADELDPNDSTCSMDPCCPAGRGVRTRACTQANTKRPV